MPPLVRIGKTPVGSYMNPLALPHQQQVNASVGNLSTGAVTRSRGGFQQRVTAASSTQDRFNPVHEGLQQDSLLDDITPKSDSQLARLFDKIYRDDAVSGSAVDFIRTFSWSDFTLTGMKDPQKMKLFQAALEMFQPVTTMPEIEGEALRQGRSISTMLFDEERMTWSGLLPHDAQDCELTPIPLRGFEPMIDVTTNAKMMEFLKSKDPRALPAQKVLPDRLRKALLSGKAQLDPLTTLFVPRRVSMTDFKGTSIFWRVLPYYAIEKALLQSTISNARRRTRSILHIQAGIDNGWEPSDAELQDYMTAFIASEDDPAGAVIATRNGITTNEIRQGSDHWKVSEEQDSLRQAKMAGLGVSDAMISGDANFNTVDATLTMFVESKKVSRAHYTREVIYNRLFAQIARVNGFVKTATSSADAAHGVRTGGRRLVLSTPTAEQAMEIPIDELEMPRVHWTKNLSPQSDAAYLDILDRADQKGIPVTVSMYASASGIDLNQLQESLPDDKRLRAKLAKYKTAAPGGDAGGGGGWGGGGGGGAFSSAAGMDRRFIFEADYLGLTALASAVGLGPDCSVLGLSVAEVVDFVDEVTADNRIMAVLSDWPALNRRLFERFGEDNKVEAMKYVLNRANYSKIPVSDKLLITTAETIAKAAQAADASPERLRFLREELVMIQEIYTRAQEASAHTTGFSYEDSRKRDREATAAVSARRVLKAMTGVQDTLPRHQLYSGLTH